jgi:hypothetical protein
MALPPFDPRMPDMTAMKGGQLAAIIRERVLRDIFPAPDLPTYTYIHPKWPHIWAELRTRCDPFRSAAAIVIVIAMWPFQLPWWIAIYVWSKPIVRALLLTIVLGGAALWFWSWPGLLVVCLFIWLFTMFLQHQKSSAKEKAKAE